MSRVDTEAWGFWIWWYDGLLNGTAPAADSPLLIEIATSDEIDWEDEAQALATINAIWKKHGGARGPELDVLQRSNDGVLVGHDPERDRFYQEEQAPDRAQVLAGLVGKLRFAHGMVDCKDNLRGVFQDELALIAEVVTHHPENAVLVHFACQQAHGIMASKQGNPQYPQAETEPMLGVLDAALTEAIGVLGTEPDVREAAGLRPDDTALLDSPQALAAIEAAAEEVALVSDGALAAELPAQAAKMRDGFAPRGARVVAAVRSVSVLMQVFVQARYRNFKWMVSEAEELSGRASRISRNVAEVTENMKAMGKDVAKVGVPAAGAIGAMAHSDKLAEAVKWIVALF